MEEAEKRRDRLRSMRVEAAAADAAAHSSSTSSDDVDSIIPLSNPLLLLDQQQPQPPALRPRFDFYTDPLAAFSSNKPNPHFSSSSSASGYSESVHHFHNNQNIHHARLGAPYYSPNSTTSPTGVPTPYHGHQVRGPSYSPRPIATPTGFRNPYPVHQGGPNFSSGPYGGPPFHNSPNPGLGDGGSPYPGHQGSPNIVPHTQGTGPWPNRCPSPGYGRGRGQWDGGRITPDSRYSGGRGRGQAFDAHGRSYYDRSMVEDPWNSLTPVIWQADDETGFFNSWGPLKIPSAVKSNRGSDRFSSNSKKPRVSKSLDKEPSLAEFLAAAADEADEDGTGAGTM